MFLLDWLLARVRRGREEALPEWACSADEGDDEGALDLAARYHADLLVRLVREHRSMLDAIGAIQGAAADGLLRSIGPLLDRLRVTLQGHVLVENVRFYFHLEHVFAEDPEMRALMQAFREDMDEVGAEALAFLARYAHVSEEPALEESFFDDFERVIIGLAHRIQREEEILYPLYATGCITEASVRASDPAHGFEPIGSDPHHDDLARGGELHRE
jgi:hypothetical protein